MTILVAGASGATGKLLVGELLSRGMNVRAIVRSVDRIPDNFRNNGRLSLIQANLLDMSDSELIQHVTECEAVASCLGHNISWRGIYGRPRELVTEATSRLCKAIETIGNEKPIRYVLMNTAGNSNRDLGEHISPGHKVVISLLRLLLPPHVDNEKAADFLRTRIGQNNPSIQWAAVRPDTLIDEENISDYEIHPSPTRSAIFNPGKTSRINVAHFMADLMTDDIVWNRWKGQMPVIYNKVPDPGGS